jgi:outer membrane protein
LELQSAKLQVEADELGVEINQAGFLPTLAVNGNYGYGHSNAPGANPSSSYTRNVGVAVSYNLLNGGATVASVQQSRYTEQADQAAADNQYRQTVSTVRQDYLKVLSDISQIQAYKQAVISGESSLAAAQAAYQVGTKTLVDLLTQQSALYQYQQSYVAGVQNYITDSLQLKLDTGILTANDLSMINQWLLSAPVTVAMKTTVSS